jgi:nascent polypeptide-associated complex subunit alpha
MTSHRVSDFTVLEFSRAPRALTRPPAPLPSLPPPLLPALEQVGGGDAGGDSDSSGDAGDSKASRMEKKTRKALLKLGMKKVSGVDKVMMRKPKNQVFVLNKPDVYKSPNSDTYAFFGEFKSSVGPDDYAVGGGGGGLQAPGDYRPPAAAAPARAAAAAAGGDDEDGDESGLEAKDIQLVADQAGVSRGRAVAALKKNGGDIVNAIMSLSA